MSIMNGVREYKYFVAHIVVSSYLMKIFSESVII